MTINNLRPRPRKGTCRRRARFERKGKASARGFRCRRRGLSQTYSAATHLRPDGRIAGRQDSTLATARPCAARSNMRWSSATSWRYSFTDEMAVVKKTPKKLTHFAHMSPGLKNHRSPHVSRVSGVDDPETAFARSRLRPMPRSPSSCSPTLPPRHQVAPCPIQATPFAFRPGHHSPPWPKSSARRSRSQRRPPERDARRDTDRDVRQHTPKRSLSWHVGTTLRCSEIVINLCCYGFMLSAGAAQW